MSDACPVCDGALAPVREGLVLRRHPARYQRCARCRFFGIRHPTWLEEAYADPIADADVGLVARNRHLAGQLIAVLPLIGGAGPYLDYGGGYGLLVRMMRDAGFDFRWRDRYAPNLFARGIEYGRDDPPCTAVTAFEVLEHVEDPAGFVAEALAAGRSDRFIFSTELFEGEEPAPDWWYLAPEGGQHISFFARPTLEALGRRLGLHLVSARGLHMLSRTPVSERAWARALSRPGRALAWARNRGRPSLMPADHEAALAAAR